jgi:hypothetical protein
MSPFRRQNPREEPGALAAHAGICAGGGQQWPSLPRPFSHASVTRQVLAKGGGQLPNSIIDIEKDNLRSALVQHVGPEHEWAVLGARLELKACVAGPSPHRDAGKCWKRKARAK